MSTFELNGIDPEKCFIIHKKDIEKRLDPFYYIPSIIELESKVKKLNPKPLRYYVKHISSGATPKTAEAEKYYSDAENGVPFLRVQNLSPSGLLELEECKYINWETHESYLKRSQVSGGDLLVKITGVGRMAVASVAPEGFVGNTNQHMVVIKTESKEASEILAAYLNTDIGEALASRRATGGTRPALDYPALLSIPIVYDKKILEIHREAIKIKEAKEAKANELLEGIDLYLLDELGIKLPQIDNDLGKRIFTISFNEITHRRLDPDYNVKIKLLDNLHWKYQPIEVGKLITKSPQYGANEIAIEPTTKDFTRYIRITDIQEDGTLKSTGIKTAEKIEKQYLLNYNDILFARSGSVGRCYIHKEVEQKAIFAGYLIRFILDEKKINPDYFFYYCQSSIYKFWVSAIERPAVQSNINSEEYKSLKIPLASMSKQEEIVNYISSIRYKANELQNEAKTILIDAKKEVEKMILGE